MPPTIHLLSNGTSGSAGEALTAYSSPSSPSPLARLVSLFPGVMSPVLPYAKPSHSLVAVTWARRWQVPLEGRADHKGMCILEQRLLPLWTSSEVFFRPVWVPRATCCCHQCVSPLMYCLRLLCSAKVMLHPGLTLRWASQISCWNLLRELWRCHTVVCVPCSGGFLGEKDHIPLRYCVVISIFLSHSQHESDTRFILILDRRLDTWTSVKMTLQKIAVSPL